jgi:hypothetical protein
MATLSTPQRVVLEAMIGHVFTLRHLHQWGLETSAILELEKHGYIVLERDGYTITKAGLEALNHD